MRLPRWPRVIAPGGLIAFLLVASGCEQLAWLTAAPPGPPDPPTLSDVDTPTRFDRVGVGGSKQAGTGVVVGEEVVVPLDSEVTFGFLLELEPGPQAYEVRTFDAADQRSTPVTLLIDQDQLPPAAPVLDPVPAFTDVATVEITGMREPGSAIWLNGDEVVAAGNLATFYVERPLVVGENQLRFSAVDHLGNESEVVLAVVTRGDFPLELDPPPLLVNTPTVTLTGVRVAGVSVEVNGVEVLSAGEAGPFAADVAVTEGANTLTVAAVLGLQRWEIDPFVVDVDLTPPDAPAVDALAPLSTTPGAVLSGTLAEPADLLVNGAVLLENAPLGPFAVMTSLGSGVVSLDVRARDAAGNVSLPAAPAPTTYVNPAGLVFSVDPQPAVAFASPLALSGVRGPDVEVFVDGVLAAPADGTNSFTAPVVLAPGSNELLVEGRAGPAVTAVMVSVFLAPDAPPAPVLDETEITVGTADVSITGQRAPDTAVLRGGVLAVVAGPAPSFVDDLVVEVGVTVLRYSLRDAYGRVGPEATVSVTRVADAGEPDGGVDGGPDAGSPDGGSPDGGSPDGGSSDGGSPDGGEPDAGETDGGDAGASDAGDDGGA